MAQDARKSLRKHKARTRLVTYPGGHGNVFGNIRQGIEWLEKAVKPRTKKKADKPAEPEKSAR